MSIPRYFELSRTFIQDVRQHKNDGELMSRYLLEFNAIKSSFESNISDISTTSYILGINDMNIEQFDSIYTELNHFIEIAQYFYTNYYIHTQSIKQKYDEELIMHEYQTKQIEFYNRINSYPVVYEQIMITPQDPVPMEIDNKDAVDIESKEETQEPQKPQELHESQNDTDEVRENTIKKLISDLSELIDKLNT